MVVPHIKQPLMQQKIAMQSNALGIMIKLEASMVREIAARMNQIQAQLANMMLQLQDIKKAKDDHEKLQCT